MRLKQDIGVPEQADGKILKYRRETDNYNE